jgi:hypothetical protein
MHHVPEAGDTHRDAEGGEESMQRTQVLFV